MHRSGQCRSSLHESVDVVGQVVSTGGRDEDSHAGDGMARVVEDRCGEHVDALLQLDRPDALDGAFTADNPHAVVPLSPPGG